VPGDHAEKPDIYASPELHWPVEIANLGEKRVIAARIAAVAREGETVGIGSGSNAYLALWELGVRVREEGLRIRVVTSSYETERAAGTLGIPTVPLGRVQPVWGVDGADEVDPDGRLIKGRGGAMFREKILWSTARTMYLAVDQTKYVDRLGRGFPIPIEVAPMAVELIAARLDQLGAREHTLRLAGGKDGPVITESGNLVIDAWFDDIPHGLHLALKALPGVIETGLFEGYSFETL
jgi:ribose 5-phosphate isomerase A